MKASETTLKKLTTADKSIRTVTRCIHSSKNPKFPHRPDELILTTKFANVFCLSSSLLKILLQTQLPKSVPVHLSPPDLTIHQKYLIQFYNNLSKTPGYVHIVLLKLKNITKKHQRTKIMALVYSSTQARLRIECRLRMHIGLLESSSLSFLF